MSITYSECEFVALGIQRAMRMCRFILSSVACPALQYISNLSHKGHVFFEIKMSLKTKYVFGFSLKLLSETFLILRRIPRDKNLNICEGKGKG
jgi:hypothetical protein